MSETVEQRTRRNFGLGVFNGSFWLLARALTDPDTILPAFAVALMGDNPLYVGLLVSVVNAGWFWPPLLTTSVMSTRQSRHTYYKISAVVRMAAMVAVWAITRYVAADWPTIAFVGVALSYLAYTSGGGLGLIPFMSVVTDSVPPERRGAFFAMRYFFGGLMAFGAGFWVKWLLSEHRGLSFPENYARLFGAATIVAAIALMSWWFAYEPRHKVETRSLPLAAQLVRGWRRARREPNFRRFMASRVMLAVAMGLFTPFIIPYAFSGLGMTEAIVGPALAAKVLSNSLSNLLWSRLSAVRGNRYLLLVAGSLEVLALLLVLSLPLLPRAALGSVLGLQFDLPLVMLLVVMAAAGAGESGQFTAHMAYLLDLAPERTRSVYMATYYLVVLPMCFMPLATATIIGAQGRYMVAFALGAVAMAVTMLLYRRLADLRNGPQPATAASAVTASRLEPPAK